MSNNLKQYGNIDLLNDIEYAERYDHALEKVIVVFDTKIKTRSQNEENRVQLEQEVLRQTDKSIPLSSMDVENENHSQSDPELKFWSSNLKPTINRARQKTPKGNKAVNISSKGSSRIPDQTLNYKNCASNQSGNIESLNVGNKIKELKSLLPDHLSYSSRTDCSVLKNTVAYIKMLKREQDDCKRLERKMKYCDLKIMQITRRIERLQMSTSLTRNNSNELNNDQWSEKIQIGPDGQDAIQEWIPPQFDRNECLSNLYSQEFNANEIPRHDVIPLAFLNAMGVITDISSSYEQESS